MKRYIYIWPLVYFVFFFNGWLGLKAKNDPVSTRNQTETISREEITREWRIWLQEIGKDVYLHGKKRFTAILFDENLDVVRTNRSYGSVGDLIYVAVIKKKGETDHLVNVTYSPCSHEPAGPIIFSQTTTQSSGSAAENKENKKRSLREKIGDILVKFPARSCFSQHVTITVKRDNGGDAGRTGTFILDQYKRYRATIQFGILFSDLNDELFGLNTQQIIYSKGPINRGPEHITSLVIYAFPRYLGSLLSSKRHYDGRDIINERSFSDRIGLMIGAGVKNPGRRFIMGLTFEIIYGINLIGAWEFANIKQLEGLKPGDTFTGDVSAIPLRNYWENGFVFGLSLDLRYVTGMFGNK